MKYHKPISTKLTATIRFGCDSYNHDDTISTIQNKWLKMAQGIAQSNMIKDNFTFWGDKVVVDEPFEAGSTLPDDHDRLPINLVEMINVGLRGWLFCLFCCDYFDSPFDCHFQDLSDSVSFLLFQIKSEKKLKKANKKAKKVYSIQNWFFFCVLFFGITVSNHVQSSK
jgi:hypothetical protein